MMHCSRRQYALTGELGFEYESVIVAVEEDLHIALLVVQKVDVVLCSEVEDVSVLDDMLQVYKLRPVRCLLLFVY